MPKPITFVSKQLFSIFYDNLRTVINSMRGIKQEHREEFDNISLPNFKENGSHLIELSQEFYDTFVFRTFDTAFCGGKKLSKKNAKELNRLYEELYEDYCEKFLENYNSFNSL